MKARKLGPAAKLFTVKKDAARGQCAFGRCQKKAKSARSRWCGEHHQLVRKTQLALNNKTWRRARKQGKAGHHVVYKGKPTRWAVEHKREALKRVKEGKSVVSQQKTLGQLIDEQRSAQGNQVSL